MKLSKLARLAFVLSVLTLGAYALAVSAAGGYHLLKKVPLAAAPGGGQYFDYLLVDADARRVYVSHGTEVVILNADDFSLIATIQDPRFKRIHGSTESPWPSRSTRASSAMARPRAPSFSI